jgi:MerR-like DNA binding protein
MVERKGYKTLEEIAKELDTTQPKVRTLIARLDIQPRRFPDDPRRLYYSPEDITRIRASLGK